MRFASEYTRGIEILCAILLIPATVYGERLAVAADVARVATETVTFGCAWSAAVAAVAATEIFGVAADVAATAVACGNARPRRTRATLAPAAIITTDSKYPPLKVGALLCPKGHYTGRYLSTVQNSLPHTSKPFNYFFGLSFFFEFDSRHCLNGS